MKRQRKKYDAPTRRFDKKRLEVEREILKKHGLKTKKELWRVEAQLRKYRRLARELAAKRDKEMEKVLIKKLIDVGILKEGSNIDDVLNITLEDFLNRRLQTYLVQKGLAKTAKQARQLIVHGHVRIDGRRITHPSYVVGKNDESSISLETPAAKKVETKPVEQVPQ